MNTEGNCPIWGTKAETQSGCGKQELVVNSPRAGGRYCVTAEAKELLKGLGDIEKARLTSWLVKQRWLGVECPKIDDKTINDEEYGQSLSHSERMNRLLKHIEQNPMDGTLRSQARVISRRRGSPEVANTEPDYQNTEPDYQKALAVSESIDRTGLLDLLDSMREKEWLKDPYHEYEGGEFPKSGSVRITAKGHEHLEELRKAMPNSSKVFVAMWFDRSMSKAWEKGIKPAIRDSGYEPFRVDEAEDAGRIDDRIIAEIRRSGFIVADLTHGAEGARGSVYYEAGFAHGLGKPVIFTCRKDLIEKIHFDIRQYYHILWEKPEDLRTKLANRISAVVGDGPARNIKKQAGE